MGDTWAFKLSECYDPKVSSKVCLDEFFLMAVFPLSFQDKHCLWETVTEES